MSDTLEDEIGKILEASYDKARIQAELQIPLYQALMVIIRKRTLIELDEQDFKGFHIGPGLVQYIERVMMHEAIPVTDVQEQAIEIAESIIEYITFTDREHIPRFTGPGNSERMTDSYMYQRILLKTANGVLQELNRGMQDETYLMQHQDLIA